MSSLKMTFSLASLILLMAFAFCVTPIMAHEVAGDQHDSGEDGTENPIPLGHTLADHPTVVSIVAKPDAADAMAADLTTKTVDGTVYIKPDATANNTFVLRVTFSEDLDSPTNALADGDISVKIGADGALLFLGKADGSANSLGSVSNAVSAAIAQAMIGDPLVVSDKVFDVTITLTSDVRPVTADATVDPAVAKKDIVIVVSVDGGAVENAPTFAKAERFGNQRSAAAEFTLTTLLPKEAFVVEEDTTAPTVASITSALDTMDNVVFTLTFSEALASTGLGALSVKDFEITGEDSTVAPVLSEATDAAEGDGEFYTLTVTPVDADTTVMISLRADSITDIAGNVLVTMDAMDETVAESVMAVYDKTAPTVTITSPEALDADGNVVFTIDFSEAPGEDNGLTVADLSVSNAAPLKVTDLVEVEGTMAAPLPDGVAMRYTLTVTPTDATMPNVLDLAAGSVADTSGNMVDGERETYTPPPPDAPAAPTGLTATAGDEKVTLQWTVVADASYQSRKKSGTATFMTDGSDYTDIAAADLMAVTGSTTMKMFEVTGLTGDTEYTFEVRVTADGATPAGAAASATATPTSAVTGGLAIGDTRDNVTEETEFTLAGMLASNSFAIFTAVANDAIEDETAITGLPNLQRFFAKGGNHLSRGTHGYYR